jgi:hypothetical protein
VTQRVELPLHGPVFERALLLAREGVTTCVLGGGPGADAALEPLLTEAANDRMLSSVLLLLLLSVAANATSVAAAAELELDGERDPDDERVAGQAAELVDEIVHVIGATARLQAVGAKTA